MEILLSSRTDIDAGNDIGMVMKEKEKKRKTGWKIGCIKEKKRKNRDGMVNGVEKLK